MSEHTGLEKWLKKKRKSGGEEQRKKGRKNGHSGAAEKCKDWISARKEEKIGQKEKEGEERKGKKMECKLDVWRKLENLKKKLDKYAKRIEIMEKEMGEQRKKEARLREKRDEWKDKFKKVEKSLVKMIRKVEKANTRPCTLDVGVLKCLCLFKVKRFDSCIESSSVTNELSKRKVNRELVYQRAID